MQNSNFNNRFLLKHILYYRRPIFKTLEFLSSAAEGGITDRHHIEKWRFLYEFSKVFLGAAKLKLK